MKKILLLVIFILCSFSVDALTYSYSINHSKLPFNYTQYLNFSGVNNTNLTIVYGTFTSGNKTYTFEENVSLQVPVNIYLPNNTQVNSYTDGVVFNFSNYTSTIFFSVLVINDTPVNYTEYYNSGFGNYEFPVCDFFMPYTTRIENVSFKSYPNMTFNVTYNRTFFNMTDFFTTNAQGYYYLNINITIQNLTTGRHLQKIIMNNTNSTYDLSIVFNIKDCITPPMDIMTKIQECKNISSTQIDELKCIIQVQTEYYNSLLMSIIESQGRYIVNNTEKVYVNQTVLVPAIPLNNDTLQKTIENFPNTMIELNELQKRLEEDIQRAIIENQNIQSRHDVKILELTREFNSTYNMQSNRIQMLESNISYYEKHTIKKSTIYWFVFLILLGAGLVGLILLYELNELY